jgi:hypothetical protein
MSQYKQTPTLRSAFAISMIIALLVLGFCPLRNNLGNWLFKPASAAPKTNGAHLLTANDVCKMQFISHANTGQQNTLLPPLTFVALAYFFGFGLQLLSRIKSYPTHSQQNIFAIPIYLLNRVWRI